jgi:subtilisin
MCGVVVLLAQGSAQAQRQDRDDALIARLTSQALAAGHVRVIVGVAAAFTPEGELPNPASVAAQRANISSAQDRVIALVPAALQPTIKRFAGIPYVALEADPPTLSALAASADVTTIAEDVVVILALAESVPLIGVPGAWSQGYTGAGWTVAMLDSGVDRVHPFLANKVVSEACYSSNVADVSAAVCPGGATSTIAPGSGVPCAYANCSHGTHVAGIATGKGAGFSGVARDASIISVQIFSFFPAVGGIGAWTSDVMSGLNRVYALKDSFRIAAVNLSLGGGGFTSAATCDSVNRSTKAVIDQLRSVGIPTVIASGNAGLLNAVSYPACISSAVSVGSIDDGSLGTATNAVSYFTNRASFLRLLAPGQWINSSVPGGGFANFSGTSMAAPHVAGAWALIRSAVPQLSVSKILNGLQSTGVSIFDPASGLSRPRLNVESALAFLVWGSSASRTPTVTTAMDYDNDGKSDVAVYRSSTGDWFIRRSSNGSLLQLLWGATWLRDRPVPADYDGDGRSEVAIYRQTAGQWIIRSSINGTLSQVSWGAPSLDDLPVPADYDGDGRADIAVYRGATGEWFVLRSSNGMQMHLNWGAPSLGDIPVPADYDGDGKADFAVYRGSTGEWFIVRSADQSPAHVAWGAPTLEDVPVPADYDGDGRTDIAVYRAATGQWFVAYSSGGYLTPVWGAPSLGDVPAFGDFDGDGKADVAVYRFSTGEWFILRSSDQGVSSLLWGAMALGDSVREY